MTQQLKAVCFDMDGVLIDTMPLHAQAWMDAVHAFHLSVTEKEIYLWEGEPGVKTARRLLRRSGKRATQQALSALLAHKEHRFALLARSIKVLPVWLRLLTTLKQKKVACALVTGTSSRELHRVLPKSVTQRFDVRITGDRVTHGKPHPEPYEKAMKALRVKAAHSVVVENAPHGIRSGKRAKAGLVLALAGALPVKYLHEADLVVKTPAQLASAIRKLCCVDNPLRNSLELLQ